MAISRQKYGGSSSASSAVYSSSWLEGQLMNSTALLIDEVEDMAYQTRRELEWLNSTMTHYLDPSNTEMTEMLQSPRKNRGTHNTKIRSLKKENVDPIYQQFPPSPSPKKPFAIAANNTPKMAANSPLSTVHQISPSPARPTTTPLRTTASKPVSTAPLTSPSKTETLLKSPHHSTIHSRLVELATPKIPAPSSNRSSKFTPKSKNPQSQTPSLPAPVTGSASKTSLQSSPFEPKRDDNHISSPTSIIKHSLPASSPKSPEKAIVEPSAQIVSPIQVPVLESPKHHVPASPSPLKNAFSEISDNETSENMVSENINSSSSLENSDESGGNKKEHNANENKEKKAETESDNVPSDKDSHTASTFSEGSSHRDSVKIPLNDTFDPKISQEEKEEDEDSSSETPYKFAKLPAREPYTKKSIGKTPSRERSWIDHKSGISALASLSSAQSTNTTPGKDVSEFGESNVALPTVASASTTITAATAKLEPTPATAAETLVAPILDPQASFSHLYPDLNKSFQLDGDDLRLSLLPAANSSPRISNENMVHKSILDMDIEMPDLEDDSIISHKGDTDTAVVASAPTTSTKFTAAVEKYSSKTLSDTDFEMDDDHKLENTKTAPTSTATSTVTSPIRPLKTDGADSSPKPFTSAAGTNASLLSATMGAFKRAKKLLFEHSAEKELSASNKIPLEQQLLALKSSEASRIPRSPSRTSPIRSPFKSSTSLGSPLRAASRLSPATKNQQDETGIGSKTFISHSTINSPIGGVTISTGPKLGIHSMASKSQPSLPTKNIYPDVPKLSPTAKTMTSTIKPLHFEPINRKSSPALDAASVNATFGSPSTSPQKPKNDLAHRAHPSVIHQGTRALRESHVSKASLSSAEKQELKPLNSTIKLTANSGLPKQQLRRQNATSGTAGNSYKPNPVIPTPSGPLKAFSSKTELKKKSGESSNNRSSLLSSSSTTNSHANKPINLTSISLNKTAKTNNTTDSFARKFKTSVTSKPKEDIPASASNSGSQQQSQINTYANRPAPQPAKKRTSVDAFGSPLDQRKSINKHQRMSNLGEPQRVTQQQQQQQAKKSSYTPLTSSTKSTLKKNTAASLHHSTKSNYGEGVKFSNEKLKFTTPGSTYRNNGSTATSTTTPKYKTTLLSTSTKSITTNALMTPANQLSGSHASKKMPPPRPSTSTKPTPKQSNAILPEIYSESEDDEEGSVLMDWANSPELQKLLLKQQNVDPDTVFGPIAPLKLDEVFRSVKNYKPTPRVRPRSSSASWLGQDKLSQQEIDDYAKAMGYKN